MAPLNPFAPLFIPSAAAPASDVFQCYYAPPPSVANLVPKKNYLQLFPTISSCSPMNLNSAADPFSSFPRSVTYLQIYRCQQPNYYNYHYSYPRPHLNNDTTVPFKHANEHALSAGCYYSYHNMPMQITQGISSDASARPLSEEIPCVIKEVVKREQHQKQKQEKKKETKKIHCPDHYEVKRAIIVKPNVINKWKSKGSTTTTLMIRNIPNKFDNTKMLDILDGHCRKINEKLQAAADHDGGDHADAFSEFDFLYLPMDFRTGSNYGYAFVNFTTPAAAQRLYTDLHHKSWGVTSSRKICEVTRARIQGLAALLNHFKGSNFICEKGDYRPTHFVPSRNGMRVTNKHYIGRHIFPIKAAAAAAAAAADF